MEPDEMTLIRMDAQADERGRISLGREARNKYYQILINPNGDILLRPMTMIPESEAWLFKSPTAKASLERGLKDAREGKVTTLDVSALSGFADSIPDDVDE